MVSTDEARDVYAAGKILGAALALEVLRDFYPNLIGDEVEDLVYDNLFGSRK